MAKEISISVKLNWSKGGESIIGVASEVIDQQGDGAIGNVQVIDTTSEQLIFGDVDDPIYVFFKNEEDLPLSSDSQATKDAKNDRLIFIGQSDPVTPDTVSGTTVTLGNAIFRLKPGQSAPIPDGGATWYAIARHAGSKLYVMAVDK